MFVCTHTLDLSIAQRLAFLQNERHPLRASQQSARWCVVMNYWRRTVPQIEIVMHVVYDV